MKGNKVETTQTVGWDKHGEVYTEPVYQYRVMRQMNDAERNPNSDWSLVFSTMDIANAVEVLQEEIASWARTGDAFKIKNSGVPVEYIKRSIW